MDWNDHGIDPRPHSDVVHGTPRDWFEPYGFRVAGTEKGEDYAAIAKALLSVVHERAHAGPPRLRVGQDAQGPRLPPLRLPQPRQVARAQQRALLEGPRRVRRAPRRRVQGPGRHDRSRREGLPRADARVVRDRLQRAAQGQGAARVPLRHAGRARRECPEAPRGFPPDSRRRCGAQVRRHARREHARGPRLARAGQAPARALRRARRQDRQQGGLREVRRFRQRARARAHGPAAGDRLQRRPRRIDLDRRLRAVA